MIFTRSQKLSLLKTISYRVISTSSICLIALLLTGSIKIGMTIGLIELVVNTIIYYIHERVWIRLQGREL